MKDPTGLPPGTRIDERFTLTEPLPPRGLGERHLARDSRSGNATVCLKILRPTVKVAHERFGRRAIPLTALRHPRIVPVTDWGVHDGRPYVVTAPDDRASLRAWLEEHRAASRVPPLAEAMAIVQAVARAVEAAHGLSPGGPVLHQCLTPGSITFARTTAGLLDVRVEDFALVDFDAVRSTRLGRIAGISEYVAPEQAMHQEEGPATDLFALGVLLVDLLTGHAGASRPFWQLAKEGTVRAHVRALRADVPDAMWTVVGHALAADPAERPARASDLLAELEAATPPVVLSAARAALVPADALAPKAPAKPAGPSLDWRAPPPRDEPAPRTFTAVAPQPAAFRKALSAPVAPPAGDFDVPPDTVAESRPFDDSRTDPTATPIDGDDLLDEDEDEDPRPHAPVAAADFDEAAPATVQVPMMPGLMEPTGAFAATPTVLARSPLPDLSAQGAQSARAARAANKPASPMRADSFPDGEMLLGPLAGPRPTAPPRASSPAKVSPPKPSVETTRTGVTTRPSGPHGAGPHETTASHKISVRDRFEHLMRRYNDLSPRQRIGVHVGAGGLALGVGLVLAISIASAHGGNRDGALPSTVPLPPVPLPVALGSAPAVPASVPRVPASVPVVNPAVSPAVAARGPCPAGMVLVDRATLAAGRPATGPVLAPFCIDRTEVTVTHYRECVNAGRCGQDPATARAPDALPAVLEILTRYCTLPDDARPEAPVNCVAWLSATDYCNYRGARLPSDAEWDLAAGGVDGRTYPWGEDPPTSERVNGCGAECRVLPPMLGIHGALYPAVDTALTVADVGLLARGASPYGALDMSGNVEEWTADRVAAVAATPGSEAMRIARGGAWPDTDATALRVLARRTHRADDRLPQVGFRCALTVGR